MSAPLPDLRGCIEIVDPLETLVADTLGTCRVRLINRSTRVWAHAADHPIRLCYHWLSAGGTTTVHDGLRTPLTADLAPQDSVEILVQIKAPSEASAAILEMTIVAEWLAWGETCGFTPCRQPVAITDLAHETRGAARFLTIPSNVLVNEVLKVALQYDNQSNVVWPACGPHPFVPALRWLDADGRPDPTTPVVRIPMRADIAPGAVGTLTGSITAPPGVGAYTLEATAVREACYWLDQSDAFMSRRVVVTTQSPRDVHKGPHVAHRRRQDCEAEGAIYRAWLAQHGTPGRSERALLDLQQLPCVHVIIPIIPLSSVDATADLSHTLASLTAQWHPGWRATVIGNMAPQTMLQHGATPESRLRFVPYDTDDRGVLINQLLKTAEDGLVLIVDPGDTLEPHALAFFAAEAKRHPEADWFTCDEDARDDAGDRHNPLLRPPPNDELLLTWPLMIGRASVRASTLRRLGMLAPGLNALALCGAALADAASHHGLGTRWRHLPHILMTRGLAGTAADQDLKSRMALATLAEKTLRAAGRHARVEAIHAVIGLRVRWPLPATPPLVSIIIPTRDEPELLRCCVGSLLQRTNYPRYEIILVDHENSDPAARAYIDGLAAAGAVRVLPHRGPFNWAAMNNRAAREAQGDVLILLNDDTEVIHEGWLHELVSQVLRPEVAAVGPALWFADNRLQHGGIRLAPGVPGHFGRCAPRGPNLPLRLSVANAQVGVTGACLAIRRAELLSAGGLDENELPIQYNDVDLCLRLTQRLGRRVVWTPHAELFHWESATRGKVEDAPFLRRRQAALSVLNAQYFTAMQEDPAFSPNLARGSTTELAAQPRVSLRETAWRLGPTSAKPKLAIVHIPKTAGSALRLALQRVLPASVLVIDARENLLCHEGHPEARAQVAARAAASPVWVSHFGSGFGKLLGVDAIYATVLREPVRRLRSQYTHLVSSPTSPLHHTPFVDSTLEQLLQWGILQGNVMVHALAGRAPESVTWRQLQAAHRTATAQFVGFRLPDEVWLGNASALRERHASRPEDDLTLLEQAWSKIKESYAFVGLQEQLDKHMNALTMALGWEPIKVGRDNVSANRTVVLGDSEAIAAYTRLDRLLYERIANLNGGLHLVPERLERCAAYGLLAKEPAAPGEC